ncbi:MAG: PorV/PorQ family protein [candidate division KSB1 bacterium]|nr:PorV/PorQ family protein [candidate division KSB1 bacterium]MDZ7274014.1 PorV/PorQ family protein [candidate division KSB1 bacterium]MDZ7286387.1 PorV/PorQ family protein [candidate division KSB1 bacterium]MDZ7296615.1 PorV/PorQ family protein [candidate division KSB1 bacterium]MDZ7306837.1 PorV/PorQ family protein [candidate division KSB1 bacterium]
MLLVCLPRFVLAQEAGKSGLAFLKIGVGGRAAALGEAYVALAQDATAIYWNPAGLAQAQGTQLAFCHLEWLQSINHDFYAVSFAGFDGVLGLGLTMQSVPGIEMRDRPTAEPIGTFDGRDLALALAYGRKHGAALSWGLAAKYLYEKIYLHSASGFAVDFGAAWQKPGSPVRVAASVQNLGSMGAPARENIALPALLRAGAAWQLPSASGTPAFALTFENVMLFKGGHAVNAGMEYWPLPGLAARAGYQLGRENRGLAAGFGATRGRFTLDYGYLPFDQGLGATHRFALLARL